jgi:hypothetical protein
VTRARLLRTGLPAPFERDHGTAAERRGDHAADVARTGRRRPVVETPPPEDEDVDLDSDVDALPNDLGGSPEGPASA